MKEKNLLRKESEQNISTEKYIKIFGSLAFVIDLIVSMQVSQQHDYRKVDSHVPYSAGSEHSLARYLQRQ